MYKNIYPLIITIIIVLILNISGVFVALNERIYDNYVIFNRLKTICDQIVIIEIDEKSLTQIGEWPWTRDYHRKLLEFVLKAHPAVIGINLEFINSKNAQVDGKLYEILKSSSAIVLSASFTRVDYNGKKVVIPAKSLFPEIKHGHTYIKYSDNSVVRGFIPFKIFPAFSIMIVNAWLGKKTHLLESFLTSFSKHPASFNKEILIDYRRPPDKYNHYSFIDVYNGKVPLEKFQNKIILIGLTAKNLTSSYNTPFANNISPASSSIELQAQIIDSLLNYRKLTSISPLITYVSSLLIALLFYFLIQRRKSFFQGVALVTFSVIILALDYVLFSYYAIWYPPVLLLMLIFIISGLSIYFTTVKIDNKLEKAFSKYSQRHIIFSDTRTGALDKKFDSFTDIINAIFEDTQNIHTILEGVANGILLINKKGSIMWANAQAMTIFKDILVLNENIELLLPEITLSDVCSQIENDEGFSKEMTIAGAYYLVIFTPLKKAETSYVIIFNDITYLKELDRFKQDMFRMAHHELINPLMIIQLAAENISFSDNPLTIKENAQTIEQTTELILGTVNNFLSLSRLEGGKIQAQFSLISMPKLIEQCINLNKLSASRKNISVYFNNLYPEDLMVVVDHNLFSIALNNLISNAIKYSGVDASITIELLGDQEQCTLKVIDTGVGIAEEEIEMIFEKFYRSRNNINTQIKGSGLGLFIVEMVVELHQGSVSLESHRGQGSTFTITLPLKLY